MRFFSLFASLAAISGVSASYRWKQSDHGDCLPRQNVDTIVDGYVKLVGSINSLTDQQIDKLMHSDFTDWSNSIAAFFGVPYDVPIFPSKEDFVNGQKNANQTPIEVEQIITYSCDSIVIIFNGLFDGKPSSRGIAVLSIEKEHDDWKIIRVDVEFNSLAWAVGLGGGYKVFTHCQGLPDCSA